MANARIIKRRVNSVQNIAKITKAMQLVSASKTRYSQKMATSSLPYMNSLLDSLEIVASVFDQSAHPFLGIDRSGADLLIVISPNKGLCGSLNTNLFKKLVFWSKDHPNAQYIAVGQKAVNFLRIHDLNLIAGFTDWPEKTKLSDVVPLLDLVKERYLSGSINRVDVLFTDFINTLSQRSLLFRLLPIEDLQIQELGTEFQNKNINLKSKTAIKEKKKEENYLLEPNPKELLDFLLNYYIEMSFYHLVLEALASEHSARMIAMKSASDNAKDLVEILKLEFNKSRQTMITNELLDISSAKMR
ncbi:MAG: ATP synthase gamma chain [Candidatus Pacebacteria bacterium GW2011_GWF2_38_9]|nr:MAG: ATP synthase F1 subcomplex gamma subunit [candidate division TM6 bacterium GW2011_GWF2_28_16]KKQ09131.1 MAG: ATP synthase gamma chain [Candidatus Pacebacteria bacterium GW2011_GWF1_36_5]KKQ88509.1 MAG: ATP synthase gamma chain [Candidatus Pacebacteria bacterium GW2011_GWF2_38_9]HAZ73356.1 ATP synthase F1 subunit gamma [Candidatus Paceibacterota bacterium]